MDPYLGELRVFPFNIVPTGWAACNGQLLNINTNAALYSLVGTMYGGDGKQTFGVPDLQGRAPMCVSANYVEASKGGTPTTTLTTSNMPLHTHTLNATSVQPTATQLNLGTPTNNILGLPADAEFTAKGTNAMVAMAGPSISTVGTGLPFNNMQPYLALNICIAIAGIYPQRP